MNTGLIVGSFVAGIFSILAPCVVGILPAMVARGVDGRRMRSPLWVVSGLAISIVVFSILLKSTTLLLGVPDFVWRVISGGIVIGFGAVMLWPIVWERLMISLGVAVGSQRALASASEQRGRLGDMLLGASLGPVFSACSPTYLLIVATILPVSPAEGLLYLLFYVLGLALMIFLVVVGGRALVVKLGWGINPQGVFRRILGFVLVAIGIIIVFSVDKTILSWLVSNGWYDWQIRLESIF